VRDSGPPGEPRSSEDWGQGFDLLFKESSSEAGISKIASIAVVGVVGSKDPVPVELEGDCLSVNMVMEESLVLEHPKESDDTVELKRQVQQDGSLKELRELATIRQNGYCWEKDLVMRHRQNVEKRVVRQICLQKERRKQVMLLTHEHFGHLSKAEVVSHLQKSFYWPTMWKDVSDHCRSCEVCQRVSKTTPKRAPMVPREVLIVPFERVCVDIVGPLPRSKNGHRFLLTYIDVASRWPEAVPCALSLLVLS